MIFLKKWIHRNKLSKLAEKIEKEFNTLVKSYGVASKGSRIYNQLVVKGKYNCVGYITVPVDEYCEFLITRNPRKNYDLSNMMDLFHAQQNLIHVDEVMDFISSIIKNPLYKRREARAGNVPRTSKTIPHMEADDNYIIVIYHF